MNTENVLNIYLIGASLLPVIMATAFYLLEKKTKFGKMPYVARQIIVGISFGILACLATQFGVKTENVVLNVRNASPLIAGLLFGGPAGIISGVIGGIYRWVSVFWGIGEYSRLACTISTVLAGFIGASCRRFMFDNKKASGLYGLVIGIATEVLHMLILFITKMDNIEKVFFNISECAVPMIVANGVSVMLSMMIVSFIGKEKKKKLSKEAKKENKQITQTFSFALFVCVLVSFIATSVFTYVLQHRLANTNTETLLSSNIRDVKADIKDASDDHLIYLTKYIGKEIKNDKITDGLDFNLDKLTYNMVKFNGGSPQDKALIREKTLKLEDMLKRYNVAEINIVNRHGMIVLTTNEQFLYYFMGEKKDGQAAEFMCLLDSKSEYVQGYGPTASNPNVHRKYAGISLEGGGFLQVGYDADQFQDSIASEVSLAAQNRHVGKTGACVICKEDDLEIISSTSKQFNSEKLDTKKLDVFSVAEGERFRGTDPKGTELFAMYEKTEGFLIITTLPLKEAMFQKDIALYISVFMQIIMFATLFIEIYFLIKKIVVDNIHKINNSLSQITSGNLNIQVNVRDNEEFASLSNDINTTVDTLKQYIKEAEARIDKELEFAKAIQHSALPSVFPPYPNRHDFDIFANMQTAKEVGGDFYDFYLLDNDRLGFLIADVSGKGIPAAMFMMTAKTIIKGLIESGMEVDEVFTRANAELCQNNDAGMFVTAWIGVADMRTGKLSYSNAGHNPPLIRHKNKDFEYLHTRPNFVLAGMDSVKYKKNEITLLPGDEIYLYTDGVTEATNTNNELFGEDRLIETLNRNPDESVESRIKTVKASIDEFVGEADQFDDITMLSVKFSYFQNHERIITSPSESSSEFVWEFINSRMKKAEIDNKIANKVQIAVDEIYSNILRYSEADFAEVECTLDEKALTLTFRDNGKEYNPLKAEAPDITLSAEEREIGGLGIFMVKKMASSLNYEYKDDKNILKVIFEI